MIPGWLRSSPGPKTGCSPGARHPPLGRSRRCDPHPVRRPGAAWVLDGDDLDQAAVAILTRSEDRVQPGAGGASSAGAEVAILTRSEDRVQPDHREVPGWVGAVAILTRSEDRVQRHPTGHADRRGLLLRSSPGPKTGCSTSGARSTVMVSRRCDPHPVRRPGAAFSHDNPYGLAPWLRSSPGPKTGCSSTTPAVKAAGTATVAILTRSEDRVQRTAGGRRTSGRRRCDPHPVRRPGAALRSPAAGGARIQLRSSPGPKTGCSR